ncbi:hypothetical protein [Streptomyces sporangiiformans]|uniref:Uncharacterized protein n=1 Tax=Streptomyces sporangiiformans TaxID=2315329 RepID=A0A505DHN5_9ACTN|nr:hypothetical protein [Streptomyces sporangiiformans]TPQ20158.1 hypothetical protein FGD71_021930 [Streptomyces sporangiiformans]
MISLKRSIDDMPGDPRRLVMDYHLSHHVSCEGDQDGLDEWTVSLRVERFKNRTAGGVIGSMTLFRLRLDDRYSPFPFADAESYDSDLFNLVLGIYDLGNGGYRQAFRDAVTSSDGDLLVLYNIQLDETWRGFGLGPILASQAIWTLADGCSAVTTATSITEYPEDQHALTHEQWTRANEKITALWESIGFRRHTAPLGHLLDPRTTEARDLRNARRQDFDQLVDAYRAALHR